MSVADEAQDYLRQFIEDPVEAEAFWSDIGRAHTITYLVLAEPNEEWCNGSTVGTLYREHNGVWELLTNTGEWAESAYPSQLEMLAQGFQFELVSTDGHL